MTVDSCRGGPRQCMDDICRSSEIGWCGRHASDYADDPADADYADDIALTWGWNGRLEFTEDHTRQAAIIGYQETSELRA